MAERERERENTGSPVRIMEEIENREKAVNVGPSSGNKFGLSPDLNPL